MVFSLTLLTACAIPTREPVQARETPRFTERTIVLVFEREGSFAPVKNASVTLNLSPPAVLISPSSGHAVTGQNGELELTYQPVAIYDEPALNDGDIIADFPARLKITLDIGRGEVYEWDFEENLSYARYQDPLYQGLNRDPDPGPAYVNLILR
jgi:hypothetical protein